MTPYRWLIWTFFTLAWTLALVLPIPERVSDSLDDLTWGRKVFFAKSCHILAYAAWTFLTGWLRVRMRYRFLLAAMLMAHGSLTELIQITWSNRGGSLTDVAWDHLGVALGFLLSWKWWSAKD